MDKATHLSKQSSDMIEASLLSTSTPADQNSWATLSQSLDLFFKSLKFGRIRGIVDIIDAPNHDHKDGLRYNQLIRELTQHDILITMAGRRTADTDPNLFQSAGDGLSEFCTFTGVQPVLYIERIEDTKVIDFYNNVAQRAGAEMFDLPVVTVAPDRYHGQTGNFGNIFTMKKATGNTSDLINTQIHEKRLALDWCDRCGGAFSPFS